jgi:hypothetical protein
VNKTRRQYNCPYGNNKKVTHLPRCRKFVEPFRQQPPLLGHVPNLALHDRALHPNTLAHVFLLANLSTKHGVSLIAYTHANKNKLTFASSIRARSGSLFSNSSLNACEPDIFTLGIHHESLLQDVPRARDVAAQPTLLRSL